MTLTIRTIDDPYPALGIAAHFLARRAPFSDFRFGDLVRTIDHQVRRRHALFAFEGEKMVGYIGWALLDVEEARTFGRTGHPPLGDQPDGHDVIWVTTIAAAAPGVTKALTRACYTLHGGMRAMGVRYKANGKRVLFNQPIRRCSGQLTAARLRSTPTSLP